VSPRDWDQLRAVAQCFWNHSGISTSRLVSAAICSYVREECARAGITEAELTAMSPAQRKEFGDRWREEANAAFKAGRRGAHARVERVILTLDPRERAALEYLRNSWFEGQRVDLTFVLATVARFALLNPDKLNDLARPVVNYCEAEGIEDQLEFLRASLAQRKEYKRAGKQLQNQGEA
jgi:hypothetical protein